MDLIKAFTSEQFRKDDLVLNIGDTVKVHNKIKEGARERIQLFEGTSTAAVSPKPSPLEEFPTV